jgi:hypothetical protein
MTPNGVITNMPVKLQKLKGGKVRVSTPNGVKAKATTPGNAAAQKRLLNAVEHGWTPTKRK